MSGSIGQKFEEGRVPGGGHGGILQPVGDANDIEGGGRENVLQPELGQPDIASLP